MVDRAIPTSKSSDVTNQNDVELHITFVVNITKGDRDVLEIVCSAWPDSIEISHIYVGKSSEMPAQAYVGPEFRVLDGQLQVSLYDFLEARGITGDMASFSHGYMVNKDRTEMVGWLDTLNSYVKEPWCFAAVTIWIVNVYFSAYQSMKF